MTTQQYLAERDRIIAGLRTQRGKAGLSQWKLSEAIGLERDTVAGIEQGKRTPRLDTLIRLADAFDLRVELVDK